MTYPIGYGEAEHRRALDALLADLATHGQTRAPANGGSQVESPAQSPAQSQVAADVPRARQQARVLGATSASGHCQIELRMHPLMMLKP